LSVNYRYKRPLLFPMCHAVRTSSLFMSFSLRRIAPCASLQLDPPSTPPPPDKPHRRPIGRRRGRKKESASDEPRTRTPHAESTHPSGETAQHTAAGPKCPSSAGSYSQYINEIEKSGKVGESSIGGCFRPGPHDPQKTDLQKCTKKPPSGLGGRGWGFGLC